jgi:hypothetical protein
VKIVAQQKKQLQQLGVCALNDELCFALRYFSPLQLNLQLPNNTEASINKDL